LNCRILWAALLVLGTIGSADAGAVYIPVIVPSAMFLPKVRSGDYRNIHSVAVLSAVGQSMTLQKAGLLLPQRRDVDITSWKLDDQVESALRQYLGTRYAIKDIPADRGALARIPNGAWDFSKPAFHSFLTSLPGAGVDAFVVVRPDHESETPGLSGLAVENDSDGVFNNPQYCWANFEIDVADTRSLKIIASAYSRVQIRKGEQPGFAGYLCDGSLKLENDLVLSNTQLDLLHAGFSSFLNVAVLETLRALDMAELPEIGARSLVSIPTNKDPFAGIKSIAVASAIGDEMHFDHLGGTIFSQTHETMPIASWNLDALIESRLRSDLSRRFTVSEVPVDHSALLQSQLLDSKLRLAPSFPGLKETADVDAYVVVVKQPLPRGNIDVGGIGMYNHMPLMDAQKSNAVYANYAIVVVDAHTLKPIAMHLGAVGPAYPKPDPSRELDPAIWPEQIANITAVQRDRIHDEAIRLMNDSISETVLRMGLTGVMISTSPSQTPQQSVASH
jgi:hypothetical protein